MEDVLCFRSETAAAATAPPTGDNDLATASDVVVVDATAATLTGSGAPAAAVPPDEKLMLSMILALGNVAECPAGKRAATTRHRVHMSGICKEDDEKAKRAINLCYHKTCNTVG